MKLSTECLDFADHNTMYATHGIHPFAAKCPPQLAAWAINRFTQPAEVVLDPMSGSGTTLTEARLLGRNSYGIDIDPLSRLLSKVKSYPLDPVQLQAASAALLSNIADDVRHLNHRRQPQWLLARCQFPKDVNQEYLDYWFLPEVLRVLSLIKFHIQTLDTEDQIRDFFWVAFSSLILAKNSVANARDIVHSRHHYREHESTPDVYTRFVKRLEKMQKLMFDFWQSCSESEHQNLQAQIIGSDARHIPCETASVDFILTSPPYCNALDYVRAHALAVVWLQDIFDIKKNEYSLNGRQYIGTERGAMLANAVHTIPHIRILDSLTKQLQNTDVKMACIVKKYFDDMWQVFGEMGRVLKTKRHIVVVVCPSHIRKVEVPTHKVFKAMTNKLVLADSTRLKQVACLERIIDPRRRLLPYMQQEFGQRMQTEYVLVYQKVAL